MALTVGPSYPKRLILSILVRLLARNISDAKVPIDPAAPLKILIVELWNIGDVVLLVPFLKQLRAKFPLSHLTLLARPHARTILDGTGLIDEVIDDASAGENWLSLNPLDASWPHLRKIRQRLEAGHFDLAFQNRLHIREYVIVAMSRASRRVGYSLGDSAGLLTDAIPVGDPNRHRSDDWLRLLEPFGGPVALEQGSLRLSDDEQNAAAKTLEDLGLGDTETLVGIHPGASVVEKRWDLASFNETARILSARPDTRVLVFVDPSGYGESLGQIDGVISARVGLRDLMALIGRCSVFVGNDSGPMHIAGALGVPTVSIFGEGVERWFAPMGSDHQILGAKTVSVDTVVAAVEHAIEKPITRQDSGKSPPSTPPLRSS
ncbi:MAG: glycosyltransferase family 9 protein [Gemmatimonadales bacterium]